MSGYPTELGAELPLPLVAGALPQEGRMEIVLAAGFAASRDLQPGETVTFATQFGDAEFTVSGLLDESEGYGSTNFGRVGAGHISERQEVLRLGGRCSGLGLDQ